MKKSKNYVWYCPELNTLNVMPEEDPHFLCKDAEGIYLLLYIPSSYTVYSFYLVGKL